MRPGSLKMAATRAIAAQLARSFAQKETIMCNAIRSSVGCQLAVVLALATTSAAALAQENAPTPAKPLTAAKKASIYDASADTGVLLEKAQQKAKHDDKRILVMFGGDWCGWCHKLHELFASDGEIRKTLSYEYVLVMVDTKAKGADALLARCKEPLTKEEQTKGFGYPFLGVLDSDGKVVKAQRTDPLEVGDHHDPGRVKEFLNKWAVAPKNADAVLADGLSRAASEDKRVFLTFGAPWCGWCHKLEDWMAQPEIAAIFDREFVTVRVDIDRMTHGKEVLTRFRPSDKGGIPWFAVLDSKGKSLGDSDGPKGNIGYPFKPEEIDHFMALITKQGGHIDSAGQERLRQSLKENADRIQKQMDERAAAQAPAAASR
jgi:thioredoxin-related protein